MFILNKNCNDVYNTDHIVNIYRDGRTINVCADLPTRGGVLGEYDDLNDALDAYGMLINNLKRNKGVFVMPSDTELHIMATAKSCPTGKKNDGESTQSLIDDFKRILEKYDK